MPSEMSSKTRQKPVRDAAPPARRTTAHAKLAYGAGPSPDFARARSDTPSIDLESRNLVGHEKAAAADGATAAQPHDAYKRKAERPAGPAGTSGR